MENAAASAREAAGMARAAAEITRAVTLATAMRARVLAHVAARVARDAVERATRDGRTASRLANAYRLRLMQRVAEGLADPRVARLRVRARDEARRAWTLTKRGGGHTACALKAAAAGGWRAAVKAARLASEAMEKRKRQQRGSRRSHGGSHGGEGSRERRGGAGSGGSSSGGGSGAGDEADRLLRAQRAHVSRLLDLGDDEHYAALQLDERASAAQAKAHFRKLARLLHPDKCPLGDCSRAFLKIQAAQEVLTDNDQRAAYDRNRALERRYHYSAVGDFGLHASARGRASQRQRAGPSRSRSRW